MKKYIVALLSLVVFFTVSANILNEPNNLKDGDIIFQSSQSGQSLAVQLATGSKYSHVGVVFIEDGKPYVLEAVEPVKITPLKEFASHGDRGEYIVKRLKGGVTSDQVAKIKAQGRSWLGKHYDLFFNWDMSRLYCSELVWKLYKNNVGVELGKTKKLKDYNLTHPIVQGKLKERYGDDIPWEDPMISPGAIFESNLLETVFEN